MPALAFRLLEGVEISLNPLGHQEDDPSNTQQQFSLFTPQSSDVMHGCMIHIRLMNEEDSPDSLDQMITNDNHETRIFHDEFPMISIIVVHHDTMHKRSPHAACSRIALTNFSSSPLSTTLPRDIEVLHGFAWSSHCSCPGKRFFGFPLHGTWTRLVVCTHSAPLRPCSGFSITPCASCGQRAKEMSNGALH